MKDLHSDTAKTFFDRLGDVTAGMLMTDANTHIPMSHFADPDEGVIWFITAKGTAAHQAAIEKRDSHYLVAERSAKIYADIEGSLHEVQKPGKLDELWNRAAGAWFEEGRDDPDVRLICFRPKRAETWLTGGAAKFLYEIARSSGSSHTPDVGEHAVITF